MMQKNLSSNLGPPFACSFPLHSSILSPLFIHFYQFICSLSYPQFFSNLVCLVLRGMIPQRESIGFRNCPSILPFLQLKLDLITRYSDYWYSWTTLVWSHIWLLLLKLCKRIGEKFLEGHGFHSFFTCKFYPFEQVKRVDIGHSFEPE